MVAFLPFQRFLANTLTVLQNKEGRNPYNKLEVWSHHFDLDVMDFYYETYEEDIFHNFICHHTPDAYKTCQLLTTEKHGIIENLKQTV
jgi:hypothetical protein